MRISDKQKEERKQEIIEKGMVLIHTKGFNGCGVQEIANEVGIPKGSFYNYFKSKEDFVLDILDYYSTFPMEIIKEINTDTGLNPLQKVMTFFRKLIEMNIESKEFSKGCLIGNICQELADQSVEIQMKSESLFKTISTQLGEWLSEGKKQGILSYQGDLYELSDFLLNSMEGALIRMKSQKSPLALEAFMNILINHFLTNK